MEKCLIVGPWGGAGGESRGSRADHKTGITYIEVFLGDVIDSITFKWGNEKNRYQNSYKIGGDGGHSGGQVYTATALMKLTQLQSLIFFETKKLMICQMKLNVCFYGMHYM